MKLTCCCFNSIDLFIYSEIPSQVYKYFVCFVFIADTVNPLTSTKFDSNNVTLSHQPISSNLSISTETLNTEAQKTTNKTTTGNNFNSSAALQNITNMEMTEQKTTLYSNNQDDAKPTNETSHAGQR